MREWFRTRKAKAITALAAFAVLLGGLWGLTYTPLFAARQVSVEGTRSLTREEVMALAGVGDGANIFHLDTGAAARKLEESPWISEATVVTDLPGTLSISIAERFPVVVTTEGVALAGDGVVLPGATGEGLPLLSGAPASSPEARSAALLIASMTPAVRGMVESLASTAGELTATLESGISVVVGSPGGEGEKAEALRAVLEWASERGLAPEVIDVSVPGAPTATLPGGEALAP